MTAIPTETNVHKVKGLNHHTLYLTVLEASSLPGQANSKGTAGLRSFPSLQENPFPGLFFCIPEIALLPWFLAPSCTPNPAPHGSACFCYQMASHLTSMLRTLGGTGLPAQEPGTPPHLKDPAWITLAGSLFPREVLYSQAQRIRRRMSQGQSCAHQPLY